MPINHTSRTAGPYLGNGVNKIFPFSYKVFTRQDVLVAVTDAGGTEALLTIDADYTVTLNADQDTNPGGVITTKAAPAAGTTLAATSNIDLTQPLDLTNQGGFYPKSISNALDRMTIQIQQVAARVGLGLNVGASAQLATVLNFIQTLALATGAGLIGYMSKFAGAVLRTILDKMRETVTPEDFGANGIDDTQALIKFFAAIALGARGVMQPRVYKYNRKTGGVLAVNCASFVLHAKGATIQCIAYPSSGADTLIEFVRVRAEYVDIDGLTIDGGWQLVGGGVNGYCTAGGFFNYMHGFVLSAESGKVDNLTVHDVEGLGFTTEAGESLGLQNVQIGKLTVYKNWMIGADFRSTSGYVKNVTVGEILAHDNGTRGVGWVQVNFGDNKAAAGTRCVTVGSILSYSGGGSGVGIGQYGNTSNGDTNGAVSMSIGQIIAHSNVGHGVELYASTDIHVGHIKAFDNGQRGVYFERSDSNSLFGYVAQIDSISACFNGADGILISGWRNVQIGSITSWSNGQKSADAAGLYFYAADFGPTTETGHIQIGSVRCFDDQGAKTQDYGMSFSYYGQPDNFTTIGSAELTNNKVKDLAWRAFGKSKLVAFGELSYGTMQPDYADASRILMSVHGVLKQKWITTNAAPVAALVCQPAPYFDCISEVTIIGRTLDGSTMHFTQEVAAYKWTGAAFDKLANIETLTHKTGLTDGYSNNFGNAIGGFVVGVADTTIYWDVTMKFSTSINRAFAI